MSLGNLKKLQVAERLLKQGKTSEALEQLEQLAKAAPGDVLTINRMGDLLARQGRTAEAIGYYFKIAKHYSDGGYLPKAIAIYKKIVRLDPKSSVSLFRLGQLYLKQKLPAEAQRFLGTAAQAYEEAGDHAGAREVYETLVEADPSNPEHRARLADAMAAAGDTEAALAELLHLGDTLQRGGKGKEAEGIYRKAAGLDGDSLEAMLGIAQSLMTQSDPAGAIRCLEQAYERRPEAQVSSLLALAYERAGRGADTDKLLQQPQGHRIPDAALLDLLEHALAAGQPEPFWARMDTVFATWSRQGQAERVAEALERMCQAEDPGHVPALRRYAKALIDAGSKPAAARVLEQWVHACRASGDTAGAEEAVRHLQQVAPASQTLASPAVATPPPVAAGSVPAEFEAPAVPINRTDKEFVTGRLTQAEILEKYGLMDQAQAQVLEVTARFPGHVAAQERLLAMRRGGDPAAVRETLVSLSLARRAEGNLVGACEAATEARALGGLDSRIEEALAGLGLFGEVPAPVAAAVPRPAMAAPRQAAAPAVAEPVMAGGASDGFLIDFDGDETEAAPPPASGGGGGTPVRPPGPDMLAEIRQYLQQGQAEEAQRGILALESLGYGSDELDALAAETESALRRPQPAAPTAAPEADDTALLLDLDDEGEDAGAFELTDSDDLSTITAALEDDSEGEAPLTPDAGTEQSVEEVFAQFRQAVEQEVGEDSRTHYDLAIGYKEMGLLDEAIEGFAVAARSADLAREANLMLALCQREQGRFDKAIAHYRLAAGMGGQDDETRAATLYDLAEVLIQAGDDAAALEELRQVRDLDPAYRDVGQRIEELETRLQP